MRKDSKKTKFERICEHCKGKGDTIDQCFKLIGYLEWYSNKKFKFVSKTTANVHVDNPGILGSVPCSGSGSSGKVSSSVIDPQMLSIVCKEVIKCMNQSSISTDPLTSSYANVNFEGIFFVSDVDSNSPNIPANSWIIDTGASEHMCSNSKFFSSLHSLHSPILVGLPDGSTNIVTHSRSIKLNSDITLDSVLFVPSFKHNLLYVGQLLDNNNLLAKFTYHSCIF